MKVRIGIVTSRFNSEVTEKLEAGALEALEGLPADFDVDVWSVRVPGAVEITVAAKILLEKGCAGVIALGAVIRGETAHFDSVCRSVDQGLTSLMVQTGRPIGFGVLMTENDEQAFARAGGAHGNKGMEAAQAVIEMISLIDHLKRGQGDLRTAPSKAPKNKAGKAKKARRK